MEPNHQGRSVHVLLLDSAWPYEVSANVLRFSVLQQLLNEIQPCDDLDRALGPLEIFDLIVARDTPFIRRVIEAWKDPKTSRQWLDFAYSNEGPAIVGNDNRFEGWTPLGETNSSQPEPPVASPGSAKIILQNPSTGALYRSYSRNGDEISMFELPPAIMDSWAVALCRRSNGQLHRESFPATSLPLLVIAKEESSHLFSNKHMYIVEFNPFFDSGLHLSMDDFLNWFTEARASEIFQAELAARAPGRRPTRGIPHHSYVGKLLSSEMIVNEFRIALRAVNKYHRDYVYSHLWSDHVSPNGGGVRGLSSLLVLQNVLEEVRIQQRLSRAPLPCEYFHMIAGTSTGGLIAILLGRLRMSVAECINLYEDVAQRIFGEEQALTSATRFSSSNFRQVLQETALKLTYCRFVVTIERDHVADPDRAVLLRSYEGKEGMNFAESCYLWEAALATCAAPIFFRPAQVKDKILVDGGLGHNNPSEHLINEAEKRWPGRPIGALVSIGTGKARSTRLAKEMRRANAGKHFRALMNMALVLKSIATSSEHRERSVYNYFRGMGKLDCYYRFNVDVGMEAELHEYKTYGEIRNDTRAYLRKSPIRTLVGLCAKKLEGGAVERSGMHSMSQDLERLVTEPRSQLPYDSLLASAEALGGMLKDSAPISIEWLSFYHLDTTKQSCRAGTVTLEEVIKLPMDLWRLQGAEVTQAGRQSLIDNPDKPKTGIALSVKTGGDQKPLHAVHVMNGAGQKLLCGLKRVHWLLLFRRYEVALAAKDAEKERTESLDGAEPGTRIGSEDSPGSPAELRLTLTYDAGNGSQPTTIQSSAVLGADILAPTEERAPSLESALWQAVPMADYLFIDADSWGAHARVFVSCSLDFTGWDKATSTTGKQYTWTIYFGGIR
ncbi:acyl transferase/acyl hydrolase/lysophospholipase [Rhexocercosporidium sp. MPI-PUGE-AT-0058]|nr:acyl transferase/acyl hydrolase/lysophospholipase [Rhexocercosporidium sp. MPI-PUGE-AT-0058]